MLISLIVILGIFLGSYFLYQKIGITDPLVTQISALDSIDRVEVNVVDKKYYIKVYITGVDSIQKTYLIIDDLAAKGLRNSDYEIKIVDNRDQSLEEAYYRLQPAIYEALATNQYRWLQEEIASHLNNQGEFLLHSENYFYSQLTGAFYTRN